MYYPTLQFTIKHLVYHQLAHNPYVSSLLHNWDATHSPIHQFIWYNISISLLINININININIIYSYDTYCISILHNDIITYIPAIHQLVASHSPRCLASPVRDVVPRRLAHGAWWVNVAIMYTDGSILVINWTIIVINNHQWNNPQVIIWTSWKHQSLEGCFICSHANKIQWFIIAFAKDLPASTKLPIQSSSIQNFPVHGLWQSLLCKYVNNSVNLCMSGRTPFTTVYIWLVVSTPLKNMNVNWDDYSQYMGKYKSCSSHHQPDMVYDLIINRVIKLQPLRSPPLSCPTDRSTKVPPPAVDPSAAEGSMELFARPPWRQKGWRFLGLPWWNTLAWYVGVDLIDIL